MIDIHNHILPNLDDGSPHHEVTDYYLDRIADANMTAVIFTPHFMRGFYGNKKDRILDEYKKALKFIEIKGYTFSTYCAAEVYLVGSDIVNDIQENSFMINGSRYVLVENSMTGFSMDFYENLFNLVKLGFKPILAHPERYLEIKENPDLAEDFMYRDVYLQINTGSILGEYGSRVKDVAMELIERGYVHFLGSDCHCKTGMYDFPKAVERIRKDFNDKTADLIAIDYPLKMLNNEEVPYFYINKKQLPLKRNFFQRLFMK